MRVIGIHVDVDPALRLEVIDRDVIFLGDVGGGDDRRCHPCVVELAREQIKVLGGCVVDHNSVFLPFDDVLGFRIEQLREHGHAIFLPIPALSSVTWIAQCGTKSLNVANSVESRNPLITNGCRFTIINCKIIEFEVRCIVCSIMIQ